MAVEQVPRFPNGRILVFARAPIPGQVKTRLARHYGKAKAARIYRRLLRQTLAMATAARLCPVELCCAPHSRHGFLQACRRDFGVGLSRQQGRDLGERMHRALVSTLQHSDCAVLIGSDCPSITAQGLERALTALARGTDVVLGPAEDGGYVLIGLRQPCRRLFIRMRWSQPEVLATTLQRARQAGLRVVLLAEGWDVDTPVDVKRWQRSAAGKPSIAHTAHGP